jgi:hypothetical protein
MRFAILVLSLFVMGCREPKSFTQWFGSEATKTEMLSEAVKKFHQAVAWGEPTAAAALVVPEIRHTYYTELLGTDEEVKIVDAKVQNIDFRDASGEDAVVITKIRFYRGSDLRVETRKRKEKWRFDQFGDGWLYAGCESLPVSDPFADSSPIGQY